MDIKEYRSIQTNRISEIIHAEECDSSMAYLKLSLDALLDKELLDNYTLTSVSDIKAGNRLMSLHAYAVDHAEKSISMYICDFSDDVEPVRLSDAMLEKLYWRLFYFLEESCGPNLEKYFDVESEGRLAAETIRNLLNDEDNSILKIHLNVITNRELDTKLLSNDFFKQSKKSKRKSKKKVRQADFKGKTIDVELWPIDRFMELEVSNNSEIVSIDFMEDYSVEGIPCLKGSIGSNIDYEAYLCIIPGKLLADIYIDNGSRILEGNVRAFLGTKSAKGVNNGIKKTINNEPEKFFTYNNGIAATASQIESIDKDGQHFITHIVDLQIINGGQTTATLAEAVLKKTNLELDGIFVPMKLTVIPDREKENDNGVLVYDQMIHDIAKYANSQNRVTAADLFSNDPFHVWMEKASKKYFAPTVKYNIPTGWYYERARKKYQQEQMKLKADELKRFLAKFPKKQLISKEELAMYLTAISARPNLCAKGKNWVIKDFGSEIGLKFKEDKAYFNEFFYKKCIAAAILYRTIDSYLETNKKDPDFWYNAGGYKGNIVPYAIAKIMTAIPQGYTMNWMKIWELQDLPEELMDEVARVTKLANDYFCSFSGVLVSEHCKKESTWVKFRDEWEYTPKDTFLNILISVNAEEVFIRSASRAQKESDYLESWKAIVAKGVSYWNRLLAEGSSKSLLDKSEREKLEVLTSVLANISINKSLPEYQFIDEIVIIEDKLSSEGISTYGLKGNMYSINILDYALH